MLKKTPYITRCYKDGLLFFGAHNTPFCKSTNNLCLSLLFPQFHSTAFQRVDLLRSLAKHGHQDLSLLIESVTSKSAKKKS